MIRRVTPDNAAAIRDIYNYYIENTTVSFEEDLVSLEEMGSRISAKLAASLPWFVCEENGEIVGYAYAGKWKERAAYRFCAEATVYVKNGRQKKGTGSSLYAALLDELREKGFHVAMGVITLPNEASQTLHEKFGFKKSAHFKEVGFKFDRWLDVGYWELILEKP